MTSRQAGGTHEQGVAAWNAWRREAGLETRIDLSEASLQRANLGGAHLSWANLQGANLQGANLRGALLIDGVSLYAADLSGADLSTANLSRSYLNSTNLQGADLREAGLVETSLRRANLQGANLGGANLRRAHLHEADLGGANLRKADLSTANLSGAYLEGADLTSCRVFGVSAWGLTLSDDTKQQGLIITPSAEPEITTEDIEVAQFLYLLIHNAKLRKVIDTITSKVVLILGRFTAERKAVLDAMREALRKRDLLPVIFDFAIPASRDVTETVKVLAGLALFVIADITDATEVRTELHKHHPRFSVASGAANPSVRTIRVRQHAKPEEVSVAIAILRIRHHRRLAGQFGRQRDRSRGGQSSGASGAEASAS